MLERMGFTIKYEQVLELVGQMDENFDGRISYHEMRDYLASLGFDIDELENKTSAVTHYSSTQPKKEAKT